MARRMRAGYDLAETTDDNRKHFARADGLSADAAMTAEKRRVIRNRCRYEVANNCYARGIGLTIANDTIGTGPRLQITAGDDQLETLFAEWAQEVRLPEKLRTMRFARYESGEVFAILTGNAELSSPVKLDVELVEAEQIDDPSFEQIADPLWQDGIRYDTAGNAVLYRKLDRHPGSFGWLGLPTDFTDVPARYVFHYFQPTRPGQRRGIPDITPAAQLFAELRRFSSATIAAAETAADFAAVLYSEAPPDPDGGASTVEEMDTIELTRRMATTLPQGWKLGQVQAEHPTTTYEMFTNTKLKEIARCINVPFTVALMDASVANMSATYVDRQVYANERVIDRSDFERFLNKLFREWLNEARLSLSIDPDSIRYQWYWPSLGHHVDPQKVANAAATALSAGLTSLPREYSKQGADWEEEQIAASKSLGISVDEYRELLRNKLFGAAPAPAPQADPSSDPNVDPPPENDPAANQQSQT